jgi:ATP-dependent Clp protease ATP-binding subunit ClpA
MTTTKLQVLDVAKKSEAREKFEIKIKSRVEGQAEAISAVSEVYEMIVAGMTNNRRPFQNMLFLGPSGVGKTLLVESIAEAIHGDPDCMIKIHCGEYSEDHQIARLIGSPPGYVGHDTTEPIISINSLTRGWVDNGPRISVLLFDEIEKASPRLWALLLGIMDKAELYNGKNQRLLLNHAWVFLTSNVGSRAINLEHVGFTKSDSWTAITSEAIAAAKKKFDPEFLGRLDQIITFKPLTKDEMDKVLDREVQIIWQRAVDRITGKDPQRPSEDLFSIRLTTPFNNYLLEKGTDKYGARGMRKTVEQSIAKPLATLIASRQLKVGGVLIFDRKNEKSIIKFKPFEKSKIVLTDAPLDKEE